MGSKLSRSSSARSNRPKSRWKRANRKHGEKLESSPDVDKFPHPINHERENSVSNLNDTYEKWNKRIEQQDVSSFNVDPPGAPSTFSAAYQMAPNDPRERTWSSPHDLTNHFYQGNGHPMGASSSIPYDVNPYMPSQLPPMLPAHSQQMLSEERPSKKVQFSRSTQPPLQQQGMPRSILTNTQSWSEQNNMMNEMTSSMIRQEPMVARQSVHRTPPMAINATSAQASAQKPIYVGIDHKATLAERGQTTTHRRHPKSNDRAGSDTSSLTANTHRTRAPHAHHQHKHADGNESSSSKSGMKSNRSFERLHAKLSGTNRPAPSASTIIANRQAEQPMGNEPEIRVSRGRGTRQPHSAHMEQQTLVENEIRPSRSRGTPTSGKTQQQQQQAQPQRSSGSRNNSPLRADTPRRMDNRHPNGPLMKIPISQPQRHKPSGGAPAGSTPPITNRSRV